MLAVKVSLEYVATGFRKYVTEMKNVFHPLTWQQKYWTA
jgi:hypothetical protein